MIGIVERDEALGVVRGGGEMRRVVDADGLVVRCMEHHQCLAKAGHDGVELVPFFAADLKRRAEQAQ